jgi:hypothetical protein
MRLNTLSQTDPFGENQTGTQQRLPMSWRCLNSELVYCPIKPNSFDWSRTFEKAIARKGGCYE